jgi:two-component system LytT family sensor kinase
MPRFQILLFHGLLWLGILLTQTFLIGGGENILETIPKSGIIVLGQMLLVYSNTQWLFPAFYLKKKHALYFILGLLLILAVSYGVQELIEYFYPRGRFRSLRKISTLTKSWYFLGRSFPLFMAFLLSTLLQVTRLFAIKEKESVQLRSEKLETELKFLRSQTNPHFLFNALNNIYTLTLIKSDKAPDYLLVLSDMLRYMLYECNAPRVRLEKEIGYIRHFISLNLLKDSRGLNVNFECGEIPEHLEIAPMLLIPLVENAFKHSKFEDKANGWININLKVSGESLHLYVQNSLPRKAHSTDHTGGIGLANVRRQLELIYPDQFQLTIDEQDHVFSVDLIIEKL